MACSGRLDILLADLALLTCPGGAERFAFELLEALSERHRVRALVAGEPGPIAATAAHAPGVEVIAEPSPWDPGGGDWARRLRRTERMRDRARRLLADDPPDVVVSHLDAGAGALAAAREAAVPSMLLLAGYDSLGAREGPPADVNEAERGTFLRMRSLQGAALSSATCLVAPSRAMATACERVSGRRPEVAAPVVRVPAPVPARPAGDVVFVASMWTPQKGVELLAPIASVLSHRSVVVGAPNGLPERHRRALRSLPNVTVTEAASEVNGLFAGAGVVLVPAQGPEAFGRVAFEALAAGVPTLASATGGLAEFVPAEQLVRDPGNPGAWAAAVRALERRSDWDAARRRGLAAAGHVLASEPAARIERWLSRTVMEHSS